MLVVYQSFVKEKPFLWRRNLWRRALLFTSLYIQFNKILLFFSISILGSKEFSSKLDQYMCSSSFNYYIIFLFMLYNSLFLPRSSNLLQCWLLPSVGCKLTRKWHWSENVPGRRNLATKCLGCRWEKRQTEEARSIWVTSPSSSNRLDL